MVEHRKPVGNDIDELRAALDSPGFAADRPLGPRTEEGHALAVRLRRDDTEVDWDAWIRAIEASAIYLAKTPDPATGPSLHSWAGHLECRVEDCTVARWGRGTPVARPAVPALDVETLAEAIHEASGTHSKTPTRMICDNPSWDGHRVFAARILARLSSEGHTDD